MNMTLLSLEGIYAMLDGLLLTLKTVAAAAIYALVLFLTYASVTTCILHSYTLPQADAVMMWAMFILTMTAVWAYAGWAILALTLKKKRANAHMDLIVLAFYAVCAVGALALVGAFIAMNAKGFTLIALVAICAGLAAWALWFLIGTAARSWQGAKLP